MLIFSYHSFSNIGSKVEPNNKEGYVLIEVSPEWLEILCYSRGIVGDPETWQTPVVVFD